MNTLKHLLALALAGPAIPASAQSPVAATGQGLDTLPIERMCGPDGVLGYKFGGTDAPPKLMPMPGAVDMRLNAKFAPFERAGVDSTKWSGRTYAANYTARFKDGAAALAAIENLARRFEALGWTADRGTTPEAAADRTTMTYIAPGPGEVHLYWPAGAPGPERKDGVRIELTRLGTEVTFTCTSLPLQAEHVREVLGHLPDGMPKPVEPVLPVPRGMDPALCADPARRAELLASRPEDNELMRYVVRRMNFREHLFTWKLDRLEKSGKLPEGRAMELVMAGLNDPKTQKSMESGFAAAMEMLQDVAAVGEAGKDEAAACAALLSLTSKFEKVGAAVEPQWRAMEAVIDREAARLGVSLD